VVLMAGLPLPAPPTSLNQLDGLLMVKLPFRDDLRQFTFRTFNDPSKPHVRAAACALCRAMQLLWGSGSLDAGQQAHMLSKPT
jgi:hypothetical protein